MGSIQGISTGCRCTLARLWETVGHHKGLKLLQLVLKLLGVPLSDKQGIFHLLHLNLQL